MRDILEDAIFLRILLMTIVMMFLYCQQTRVRLPPLSLPSPSIDVLFAMQIDVNISIQDSRRCLSAGISSVFLSLSLRRLSLRADEKHRAREHKNHVSLSLSLSGCV